MGECRRRWAWASILETPAGSRLVRAAAVMAEMEYLTEARVLYQRVLMRYAQGERIYYVERAKEALVGLQDVDPAVVALRVHAAGSR